MCVCVFVLRITTGGAGTPHLLASATPYVSVSRVGVVLSLLSWSSLHGQLAVMQPMLYNMLPQVFRLQELAGRWQAAFRIIDTHTHTRTHTHKHTHTQKDGLIGGQSDACDT